MKRRRSQGAQEIERDRERQGELRRLEEEKRRSKKTRKEKKRRERQEEGRQEEERGNVATPRKAQEDQEEEEEGEGRKDSGEEKRNREGLERGLGRGEERNGEFKIKHAETRQRLGKDSGKKSLTHAWHGAIVTLPAQGKLRSLGTVLTRKQSKAHPTRLQEHPHGGSGRALVGDTPSHFCTIFKFAQLANYCILGTYSHYSHILC